MRRWRGPSSIPGENIFLDEGRRRRRTEAMNSPHRRDRRPGARFEALPLRRSQRAAQVGAAARTITQRAPETLTLVRHRAQPAATTIIRLAACAVFAYLVALPVPET